MSLKVRESCARDARCAVIARVIHDHNLIHPAREAAQRDREEPLLSVGRDHDRDAQTTPHLASATSQGEGLEDPRGDRLYGEAKALLEGLDWS